jgi:hypothetical protein
MRSGFGLLVVTVVGFGAANVNCGDDGATPCPATPAPTTAPTTTTPTEDAGPTVTGSTVTGKVITKAFQPLGGAAVLLRDAKGDRPVVITGYDGSFKVVGVTPPYSVAATVASNRFVYYFDELTRLDPTLSVPSDSTPGYGGRVNVTVTPSTAALGDVTDVVVSSSGRFAERVQDAVAAPVGLDSNWWNQESETATVRVLQYTDDAISTRVASAYKGFGTATATLKASTTTDVSVTMAPVPTTTIRGAITFPVTAGYKRNSVFPEMNLGPNSSFGVGSDTSTATDSPSAFSYVVPNPAGVVYDITACAAAAQSGAYACALKAGNAPGNGDIAIDIPAAPEVTAPAIDATGVNDTTDFTWTGSPNAVYLLRLTPLGGRGGWIHIVTTKKSVKIPNLGALAKLFPGAKYSVDMFAYGPFASLDEATGPHGFDQWAGRPVISLHKDQWYSASNVQRGFTTAP